MKKQKSLINHMYQRSAMSLGGATKKNSGGEPDTRYPASEIQGKKTITIPELSLNREKEDTWYGQQHYAIVDKEAKDKYEKRLQQQEIDRYKNREKMLGGSKNVTKKIIRRQKFKKGLDNAIIFLGTN